MTISGSNRRYDARK